MHCLIFNFNQKLVDNARALGCYRIAHFIREHGWDAEVIEYAAGWNLEELKALGRSRITKNTKWIGTSHLFSSWSNTMEEFLSWVKQEYPWVRIISGSASNPQFDSRAIEYYIQGFGELALLELLKYLFSNGSSPVFNLLSSGAKKVIPAISAYPAFPMSSLMVKYQDRDFILPGEHLGVEFSRGCKFECSFCNFPVLGVKGDYSRDADDFREQLMDAYDRWGVTGYYVSDETFNDRTEKITKFADVVETLPFVPWFNGCIRADLLVARPRDREELARMGFRGQFYGIESFNHRTAKLIKKGMDPDKLKSGLIEVRKFFESTGNKLYRGQISLIAGLPEETLENIDNAWEWLVNNWAGQYWHIHSLTIPKGELANPSMFTKQLFEYGYKVMSNNKIAEWTKNGSTDCLVSWVIPETDELIWENKHMNIFQSRQIDQSWFNKVASTTQPSLYTKSPVYRLSSAMLHELTIEERLTLDNYSIQPIRNKKMHSIVKDYIEKKLSL